MKLLRVAVAAAFVAAVALVPLALDDFQAFQFAQVGIYFIAITGLVILTGYTGQISLGHGAFMAIGGYTTAIIATDHGIDPLWTVPIAAVVSGAAGFAVGIPALRLSGLYLALATFGLAVAMPALLKEFSGLTGGVTGKSLGEPEAKFGLGLSSNDWRYYLVWTIALVLLALAWLLLRGRVGRAFRAVRDSEIAAAASGVNLALYKTLAFGVSAAYAGVAGSLFAIHEAFVTPDTYPINLSITLVIGAVVAGLGSLSGIVFGAGLVEFLRIHAQDISQAAPDVIFGGVLILVVLLLPNGVAGLLRKIGTFVMTRLHSAR